MKFQILAQHSAIWHTVHEGKHIHITYNNRQLYSTIMPDGVCVHSKLPKAKSDLRVRNKPECYIS